VALQIPVSLNLVHDTLICAGAGITLNAAHPFYNSYRWNTGEKNSLKLVNLPGSYTVYASNGICTVSDSVKVLEVQRPSRFLPNDTVTCFRDLKGIVIDAGDWNSYNWYPTGEHVRSIYATYPEIYIVTVTDKHQCAGIDSILVDEECPGALYIPNSFTPNHDGLNDLFFVRGFGIKEFHLSIYNRWGEIVFTSDDIAKGWDGTSHASICQSDAYFYILNYRLSNQNIMQEKKGMITLLR